MPEGDTIYRAARAMQRVLAGAIVTGFESAYASLTRTDDDTPLVGRVIEKIEARGKWLLLYFSGDLILLTHMLMSGSWHLYRPREKWQRPHSAMRIVIQIAEWEAVGFNIPVAEFHSARTLERHPKLMKIGPDILSSKFVLTDGAKALLKYQKTEPDRQIGEALLNQQIVAGLGNVYKSEVCFAAKVNPFRVMRTLTTAEIEAIISIAHRYMASNVIDGAEGNIVTYTGLRRTTGLSSNGARLWVYRRRGEECRRCGTLIEMRKQGLGARSTFWCPLCQPMESNSS